MFFIRGLPFKFQTVPRRVATSTVPRRWRYTQSYTHGTSTVPLTAETIGQRLDRLAERFPDRESHVFPHQGIRLNFADLKQKAERLASGLIALGFKPGDRLGVWAPNCEAWILAQFATAKVGIIQVNINPAYQTGELKFALKKVGCKGILATPTFKTQNYYAILCEILPSLPSSPAGVTTSQELPLLSHVIFTDPEGSGTVFPGALSLQDVFDASSSESFSDMEAKTKLVAPDEPINIQFTSGTTGSPKGATLSHFNILNCALSTSERLGFDQQRGVLCVPVPLYHCFGMVLASLMTLGHGSTCVFPSYSFDAGSVLDAIGKERCTALYGTPTMFVDILNHPRLKEVDVSTMRTGIMAGSPCPMELMKRIVTELNMSEVIIGYGATELSPLATSHRTTDSLAIRVATVGSAMPHVEIKIADESGRILPIGQEGEICVRGYNTMLGYWGEEIKTRDVLSADKWYKTGDVGVMDEEGFCSVVGRSSDIIIRGGENIYPAEIEQFLHTHPAIADVCVFGFSDPRLGEQVCAWIRLAPGADLTSEEVVSFSRGKISHFKIPKYIKMVEEFPMTVTGKVQKFKMTSFMEEELRFIS